MLERQKRYSNPSGICHKFLGAVNIKSARFQGSNIFLRSKIEQSNKNSKPADKVKKRMFWSDYFFYTRNHFDHQYEISFIVRNFSKFFYHLKLTNRFLGKVFRFPIVKWLFKIGPRNHAKQTKPFQSISDGILQHNISKNIFMSTHRCDKLKFKIFEVSEEFFMAF